MIYLFDELEDFSEDTMRKAIIIMPKSRIEKINKFKNIIDRKTCCIGYLLLAMGLYNEYGIDANVNLIYGQFGKPKIYGRSDIEFNISHTRTGVICGLSNKPIGVDIQEFVKYEESFATYFCSKKEIKILKESKLKKTQLMTKFWCVKEAYLKLKGVGIVNDMNEYDYETVKKKNNVFLSIIEKEKYAIAICKEESNLKITKVLLLNLEEFIEKRISNVNNKTKCF